MRKSIIFLFVILVLAGCKKEPTTWDVDTLLPLLKTKLTLQQAIADSLISEGPNNELNLIYKGNLLEFNIDSVFSIPDTTMEAEFGLPVGTSIILQPGQTLLADTISSPFNMNGAQIIKITIGSGIFRVFVENKIPGRMVLDYAIPSATKNGQIFFVSEIIPAGTPSNPTKAQIDYDISGYDINMTGPNNDQANIITTQYKLYLDPTENAVSLTDANKLVMGNTLKSILPNYARGYLGSDILNESAQNEELDAFNNIVSGTVSLDEIKMEFNIENEIGVDISVNISSLTGHNSRNNTNVSLNAPIINNNLNLNRGTETGNENSPVSPSIYSSLLNNTNSNVTEFASNLPDKISYEIEINLNPLGNVSNSNDFVYDSTGINIALDAEIPFKLSANALTIVDTSDFDIDSTSQDDTKKIIGGFINIHADNWYPFSLGAQFYMVDENDLIIDSLFAEPQLMGAGVPVSGVVTEPVYSLLQASITEDKIDNLYRTKYIVSRLEIDTYGNDILQIYSQYFIDLKMIGDFKYMITIN